MLEIAICILLIATNYEVSAYCLDVHYKLVSDGVHYVPGHNICTLCTCDKGYPTQCKSLMCSTPPNCKSYEQGFSCCEFICLDKIETEESYKNLFDIMWVKILTFVIIALAIIFVVYKVCRRMQKKKTDLRQSRMNNANQRDLNSIGYIAGGIGYHPGNYGYLGNRSNNLEFSYDANTHFALWKPPGNYFPPGDAPPPYEEAVREAQLELENALNNESAPATVSNQINTYTFTSPQTTVNLPQYQNGCCVLLTRNDTANFCNKEYVNIPLSTYNSVMMVSGNEKTVNNLCAEFSCGSSSNKPNDVHKVKTSITDSNLPNDTPRSSKTEKPTINANRKCYITKCHKPLQMISEKPTCYYSEKAHQETNAEERLKMLQTAHLKNTEPHHRTISKSILVKNKNSNHSRGSITNSYHHTLPSTLRDISLSLELQSESKAASKLILNKENRSNWNVPSNSKTPILDKICQLKESLPSPEEQAKHKPQVSYHCLAPSQDDDEDYRSECENCKFNEMPIEESEGPETMTLHRKPLELEEQPYYRTSLTLPTNTKKVKIVNPKPGRESWLLTMHDYSSSDDST